MSPLTLDRYPALARALRRVGRAWKAIIIVQVLLVPVIGVVAFVGHGFIVVVLIQVAAGVLLVWSLADLASTLPAPWSKRMFALASCAAITVLVEASVGVFSRPAINGIGGNSEPRVHVAYGVVLSAVALFAYTHLMESFCAHEPRTVNVRPAWTHAKRWSMVMAALFAACAAFTGLYLVSPHESTLAHAFIGASLAFGLPVDLVGISVLFLVARASKWTRLAFEPTTTPADLDTAPPIGRPDVTPAPPQTLLS